MERLLRGQPEEPLDDHHDDRRHGPIRCQRTSRPRRSAASSWRPRRTPGIRDQSPKQIAPRLADQGASTSRLGVDVSTARFAPGTCSTIEVGRAHRHRVSRARRERAGQDAATLRWRSRRDVREPVTQDSDPGRIAVHAAVPDDVPSSFNAYDRLERIGIRNRRQRIAATGT